MLAKIQGQSLLVCSIVLASNIFGAGRSEAQAVPSCQINAKQVILKSTLLKSASAGDASALEQYNQLVKTHAAELARCRQSSWPKTQGIWLRVYPCDLKSGQLEQVLDNISNFGYNRIYLNTFYDGRVLLPKNNNPTLWPSVVGDEEKNADMLAKVIQLARQRGIKVYAWVFAMNFGPGYANRADRKAAIARNGYGETNLQDPSGLPDVVKVAHIFVDPFSTQARMDLRILINAVAQRKPDGIVFDYIRYPHRTESIVSNVRDLMIYGLSSGKTLLSRGLTGQGRELIYQYLKDGKITKKVALRSQLWRFPNQQTASKASAKKGQNINQALWQLSLAHARTGVIEFLESVSEPARRQNIPTGAVFFPKANRTFGEGVDARLQPWNEFTNVTEWAPMSYSTCGSANCILEEISLVLQQQTGNQVICPVLAGYWGRDVGSRVSLETQMLAVRGKFPQIDCVSHFAYSWLDLAADRQRRDCKLSRAVSLAPNWFDRANNLSQPFAFK